MRYHYEKPTIYISMYGERYECDHPVYSRCTLYLIRESGLAVIQQRYIPGSKETWWGEIDPWLANDIYIQPGFREYFEQFADKSENGLYPTVTVRQIMWALKMKPLKKQPWETTFDHCPI